MPTHTQPNPMNSPEEPLLSQPPEENLTCRSSLLEKTATVTRDRLIAMYSGIALGDALGLPVETLTLDQIREHYGRVESLLDLSVNVFLQNHPTEFGITSDDTQLSVAVSRGLEGAKSRHLDVIMEKIASEHVSELEKTDRGWGGSTKDAVRRLRDGCSWRDSGKSERADRGFGNGIPMKIAPVAFWALKNELPRQEIIELVAAIAAMSHRTSMAVSAGLAHVAAVTYCLCTPPEEFSTQDFVRLVVEFSREGRAYLPETAVPDDISERLAQVGVLAALPLPEIMRELKGGCYVYESLPATYALFLKAPKAQSTLFDLVNAGGDTDSNASMGGALLGALNGGAIFPAPLLEQLPIRDTITLVGNNLFDS